MKRKQRNGYLLAGGILAGFLAAVILLGLFWTPYDPAAMSVGPKLAGPSLLHPMGTDNFGRDILSLNFGITESFQMSFMFTI